MQNKSDSYDLLDYLHLPKRIHKIQPFWQDEQDVKEKRSFWQAPVEETREFFTKPIEEAREFLQTPVPFSPPSNTRTSELNEVFEGRRKRMPKSLRRYIKKHHRRSMKKKSRSKRH